jgi:hypothetical protein
MKRHSGGILAVGLVAALIGGASSGNTAHATGAVGSGSLLVGVRAAHHSGFDRIVFQFSGAVPVRRQVGYVDRLIADASGRPVRVSGRAILRVSFYPAAAHDTAGHATAATRTAFALPNIMVAVRSGDFEGVVSYGIGLAKRTSVHLFTLTRPSRIVIDIGTTFQTVPKNVYLFNLRRFAANTPPVVTKVLRPVVPATSATALMDRLVA